MRIRVPVARVAPIALLTLAACGGGGDGGTPPVTPPPPPPPPAPIVLSPREGTITRIGDTLTVAVTQNGQTVAPTFTLRSETRWLGDAAVLAASSLGGARIVAAAPGRAIVTVQAAGQTDSVVVTVAPPRPLVVSLAASAAATHVGDVDTLLLRGYRMDQLQATSFFAASVGATIVAKDSANARITVPSQPTGATCGGKPSVLALSPTGIDTVRGLPSFTRRRAGELALALGEARRLSAAQAACLRMAPVSGARYFLAYADTRLLTKAQTQAEWPWPDSIQITVADRTTAAGPAVSALAPAVAAATSVPVDPRVLAARRLDEDRWTNPGTLALAVPVDCTITPMPQPWLPFCHQTPWTVNEMFNVLPGAQGRPLLPAKVLFATGSVVAAIIATDEPQLHPLGRARLDTTLMFLRDRFTPLAQKVWGTGRPTMTSDGSGQLLILLETGTGSSFARWYADGVTNNGRWAVISLQVGANSCFTLAPQCDRDGSLGVAVHETNHTYQYLWLYQHSGFFGTAGTLWAVEGGATYLQQLAILERAGAALDGNTDLTNIPSTDAGQSTLHELNFRVRNVTRGYTETASFLRDLTQRLVVEAKVPLDDAIREIAVGSFEGWYGIDDNNKPRGLGLVARMRAKLGASWAPADALLQWTMSAAADDMTTNARYQDLALKRSYREQNGIPVSNPVVADANLVAGGGITASPLRGPGTTGVFMLSDDKVGGSYAGSATVNGANASSAVEWLSLRVR
jgi:hypothetical protein